RKFVVEKFSLGVTIIFLTLIRRIALKRLFIASLLFSATSLLGFHPASSSKTQKDCKKDCKEVSEKVCRPCLFEKSCSKWYAGAGISFADLFYYSNHQRSNFATA